jgi:hypothetical protein
MKAISKELEDKIRTGKAHGLSMQQITESTTEAERAEVYEAGLATMYEDFFNRKGMSA